MTIPKPKYRPRCPSCYGEGQIKDVEGEIEDMECQYCFGTGYDPYYTGEQTEEENEHGSEI